MVFCFGHPHDKTMTAEAKCDFKNIRIPMMKK